MTLRRSLGPGFHACPQALADARRLVVWADRGGLAGRHARIETVASTGAGGRAVVELLAHLADDGQELAWPIALDAGDT